MTRFYLYVKCNSDIVTGIRASDRAVVRTKFTGTYIYIYTYIYLVLYRQLAILFCFSPLVPKKKPETGPNERERTLPPPRERRTLSAGSNFRQPTPPDFS